MVQVWLAEQTGRCPDCGTFEWEWEDDPAAWSAGLHLCVGCQQLEQLRDDTARTAKHPEGYKLRMYKD